MTIGKADLLTLLYHIVTTVEVQLEAKRYAIGSITDIEGLLIAPPRWNKSKS
jgi:hypothetical protein